MNNYAVYKQMDLSTVSPARGVLLLYNGMIRFFSEAKDAMAAKEYTLCNEKLYRARRIISELTIALNPEAGELVDKLKALYNYFYYRSVEANFRKDPAILDEIIGLVQDLRDAWAEMMEKVAKEGVASEETKTAAEPQQ